MKFTYPESATPLELDEIHTLLQKHISTQKELDEAEAENIVNGQNWAFSRKRNHILTIPFLLKVHKKMFEHVWAWAGKYRKRDTNIGVTPHQISLELINLLDNVKFWIKNSVYSFDEIAVRFHHKLVWIHPFPNGNGRHARLMTNLLLYNYDKPQFAWGKHNLGEKNDIRKFYIDALKAADKNDFSLLLKFAIS